MQKGASQHAVRWEKVTTVPDKNIRNVTIASILLDDAELWMEGSKKRACAASRYIGTVD
jgi:hypothetical protein